MRNLRLSHLSARWLVLFAILILSGCAIGPATLHTELTSYNNWASVPAEKTYTFTRTLRAKNSLEMNGYEALVREELGKLGFIESTDPAKARLAVTLQPSVTVENWRITSPYYYDPFWQLGGFYGPRPYYYGGRYFYPYAPYSFFYDMNREVIYHRQLRLEIDLQGIAPVKRVYEGTVEADGWDGSLSKAMPYLVRALFSDFPGNNGETRQVNVVME